MKRNLILFILFGCIGTTVEIYFTALGNFLKLYMEQGILNFKLEGKSYIWMFFIYGVASILFPIIYSKVSRFPLILRLINYAVVIFCVEFTTGLVLDLITGSCPWQYSSKFAVMGYIRLDYIFFWMGFGYLIEKIYLLSSKILEKGLL